MTVGLIRCGSWPADPGPLKKFDRMRPMERRRDDDSGDGYRHFFDGLAADVWVRMERHNHPTATRCKANR